MTARHASEAGSFPRPHAPPRRIGTASRRAFSAVLAAALCLAAPTRLSAQSLQAARDAWWSGAYENALRDYRALAARPGPQPEVRRDLAAVLLEVGRLDEAERTLRAGGGEVELANALGEVLLAKGDWAAAEDRFRAAVRGRASDEAVARVNLGELLWRRGRRDEADPLLESLIDLYNGSRRLTAPELMAVGRAVRRLGVTDPALFQDALMAFDEAAAATPRDPLPHVLTGELFLEKYDGTEAHASFARALALNPKHPRALVGEARALEFDGAPGAGERAREALEVNPSSVPARVLLARLSLGAEAFERAIALSDSALAIDPASLDALGMSAAAHYLADHRGAWEAARDRALRVAPADAGLYATVADLAAQQRRYAEAAEMAARGIAVDSLDWRVLGLLGMNQLRLGAIEEGRGNVERAFAGDPYNVWFKNTLDLLDTFSRYQTVRSPHFQILLREDEAELLAPYVRAIGEEAYAALRERYGTEPDGPIRLELFPRHADFSVRTLGLTGLGALGVSFGRVLVMDSPAAHEAGEFNWASTLWHELAHAFHLGMTGNRVPRWFSEGLAVHEQRSGRPGWGHPVSVSFLKAYRDGKLPPASDLNRGFMRPSYPEEVVHSYFLASQVFAWMEETYGPGAALGMLRGYAAGQDTEDLVREVLGLDLSDFDREVDAYVRRRFAQGFRAVEPVGEPVDPHAPLETLRAGVRRHPGDFVTRMRLGQALFDAERWEEAREQFTEAERLFPQYAGGDAPAWYLARIHRRLGDRPAAAAALARVGALDESTYEAPVMEAEVRREMGDEAGAAAALGRAVLVYPYEPDLHRTLAELEASLGNVDLAVRERRAVLALAPADRAEAHFQLARALADAGELEEARRQVLRALEVAPSFTAAQDLLLELRGGG